MWMGGTPPLGYRPDGRSLAIVEEHAALVRDIFDRYRAYGNVRLIQQQLDREGVRSPERVTAGGKRYGGRPFTRGQLYFLLRNPIYIGEVPHGEKSYRGLHQPIVERALWEQVQAMLSAHVRGGRRRRAASPSPLAGRIVDADGEPLLATHACKGNVRYRYYVSRALQHEGTAEAPHGQRVAALPLEAMVAAEVAKLLDDPMLLAARLGVTITPGMLMPLSERAAALAARIRARSATAAPLIARVQLLEEHSAITLDLPALGQALGLTMTDTAPLELVLHGSTRIARSGRAVRLVQPGAPDGGSKDATLLGLIVRARRWWKLLGSGELSVTELAAREGVTPPYVCRVVRLAFLAPSLVEAIVDGTRTDAIDTRDLKGVGGIALRWAEQIALYAPRLAA